MQALPDAAAARAVFADADLGQWDRVLAAVHAGFPVHTRLDSGSRPTLLHLAAQCGHVSAIRSLLACGACVDAQNLLGRTPLHLAIMSSPHLKAVRVLVEAGSDVNAATSASADSLTALGHAVWMNRLRTTRYLLSLPQLALHVHGARGAHENAEGMARRIGHLELADVLREEVRMSHWPGPAFLRAPYALRGPEGPHPRTSAPPPPPPRPFPMSPSCRLCRLCGDRRG
jgi:hypothetical protein